MHLTHRSASVAGVQQASCGVDGGAPPFASRRPRRCDASRKQLAAALRKDVVVVIARNERDATGAASTSGHAIHSPPIQRRPPRDVRARVAAPVPSTQNSNTQQPPMPLIMNGINGHGINGMNGHHHDDHLSPFSLLDQGQQVLVASASAASLAIDQAHDRALYDEIKACDTWQDVLEVIADEAPAISLYTATQAASRILLLLRQSPSGLGKGLASLHNQPAFTTLLAVLRGGVPRMSRAQLCNSLHALAQLRVPLDETTLAAYALRTQQLASEFNARDIGQLLHGWATLKKSPGIQALDLVGFRAKMLLEEGAFEPQALSMMLTSLAALEYRNHILLRAAASLATLRMSEFTPQGVANVTYALAKLGHVSPGCLASACKVYSQAYEQYNTQEVCNLLWAMTTLRFHPQETLAVMVRSLVKRSSSLKPVDFSMLFHALGTFGVHPGNQMLSELLAQLPRQLQRFSAAELCSVFWGLGLLGETRQPIFSTIAGLLPDHFEAGRLNDALLRQTFQAFLCSRLENVAREGTSAPAPADVAFPPLMLDSMKRVWKASAMASTVAPGEAAAASGLSAAEEGHEAQHEEVLAQAPDAEGAESALASTRPRRPITIKGEVAAMIKSLRVPHELGRPTRDGLVMIDVAIKAGDERFIALQVVMEHEHSCNTGQFLGPLQFQARVLEMNGWEVRHIRSRDLKALDYASRPLFLADLLRGMGVRVAGGQRSATSATSRRAGASAGGRAAAGAVGGLDLLMAEDGGRSGAKGGRASR